MSDAAAAPRFIQIACACSESQDSDGDHSSNDYLYALDTEGRVWIWWDAPAYDVKDGATSGWHGPLESMYVPPRRVPT